MYSLHYKYSIEKLSPRALKDMTEALRIKDLIQVPKSSDSFKSAINPNQLYVHILRIPLATTTRDALN